MMGWKRSASDGHLTRFFLPHWFSIKQNGKKSWNQGHAPSHTALTKSTVWKYCINIHTRTEKKRVIDLFYISSHFLDFNTKFGRDWPSVREKKDADTQLQRQGSFIVAPRCGHRPRERESWPLYTRQSRHWLWIRLTKSSFRFQQFRQPCVIDKSLNWKKKKNGKNLFPFYSLSSPARHFNLQLQFRQMKANKRVYTLEWNGRQSAAAIVDYFFKLRKPSEPVH